MLAQRIFFNYQGYGWLLGKVIRRNGNARLKVADGTIANFIVAFEMDEGATSAVELTEASYSTDH